MRRLRLLAGTAVIAAALLVAPAGARAAEPSPWTLAFYKMLTYEAAAQAYDLVLFRWLAGAAAAPAATFVAANLAVDAAAYYAHELAWARLGPAPGDGARALEVEGVKTVTFRVVSTAGHVVVYYALLGDPLGALGFGLAANLGEAAIYLANEWGWQALGSAPAPALAGSSAGPPAAGATP